MYLVPVDLDYVVDGVAVIICHFGFDVDVVTFDVPFQICELVRKPVSMSDLSPLVSSASI